MGPVTTLQTANVILAALLALSEVLALTPLKSNSIFQLVTGALKKLSGK